MPHTHTERFHALDATRAFALLLGVVFHAAWDFIPRETGAANVDVASHPAFDWFFYTSHTFRMQTFFLIAGFFAHMMVHKRGVGGFFRNRFTRIAVPFAIGWLILVPLLNFTWIWCGNLSGRYLVPVPLDAVAGLMFAKGLLFVPQSFGGFFTLGHLWFLYYLMLLYVAVLAVRWIVLQVQGRSSAITRSADRAVAWCASSPWSFVPLSVITGLFLWRMGGWFGVDTPTGTPVPSPSVLLLYGAFFCIGWLMHRQVGLLPRFAPRWRWQLALGLLLSVGMFQWFIHVDRKGWSGNLFTGYPAFSTAHVNDWPAFLARLRSPASADVAPELSTYWSRIPPPVQAALRALPDDPTLESRVGICRTINSLLPIPHLLDAAPDTGAPAQQTDPRAVMLANRQRLESVFAGLLRTDPKTAEGYWTNKLLYSIGYAAVMWLLAFATLGFFQARCSGHSAAWRYVADSSYWIYLIHLPLLPWMHRWIVDWQWPAPIKFLLLNAVAFAILFGSYHLLVRSTFIGRVLNGRKYPFTPFPRLFTQASTTDSKSVAS